MYVLLENKNYVDKYVGVGEKQLYCKGFDYDNCEVGGFIRYHLNSCVWGSLQIQL